MHDNINDPFIPRLKRTHGRPCPENGAYGKTNNTPYKTWCQIYTYIMATVVEVIELPMHVVFESKGRMQSYRSDIKNIELFIRFSVPVLYQKPHPLHHDILIYIIRKTRGRSTETMQQQDINDTASVRSRSKIELSQEPEIPRLPCLWSATIYLGPAWAN